MLDISMASNIPSSERNKYPESFPEALVTILRIAYSGKVAVISGEPHELIRFRQFIYKTGPMDVQTRLSFEGTVLYVF